MIQSSDPFRGEPRPPPGRHARTNFGGSSPPLPPLSISLSRLRIFVWHQGVNIISSGRDAQDRPAPRFRVRWRKEPPSFRRGVPFFPPKIAAIFRTSKKGSRCQDGAEMGRSQRETPGPVVFRLFVFWLNTRPPIVIVTTYVNSVAQSRANVRSRSCGCR